VHAEFFDLSDPYFHNVGSDTESEHFVIAGLKALHHEVSVLPFDPYQRELGKVADELTQRNPDIVFNFIEHTHGDRRLAARVPALLEKLGIPYTGASARGRRAANDKAASKRKVHRVGFPVPRFVVLPVGARIPTGLELTFPSIVKLQFGAASEGLTLRSVARSKPELLELARDIHRRLGEPALCEQYIDGRELSVGIVEDGKKLLVLPIRETVFGQADSGGPRFCTERVKDSPSYRERWGIRYERAQLTPKLERRIRSLSKAAFRSLELSGYARIDLRLRPNGEPVFLEANANPDLAPRYFGIMASWMGLKYEDVLVKILKAGLNRRAFAATPSV
jgi:D-alanine-D-alanine ligase